MLVDLLIGMYEVRKIDTNTFFWKAMVNETYSTVKENSGKVCFVVVDSSVNGVKGILLVA